MTLLLHYWLASSGDSFLFAVHFIAHQLMVAWVAANGMACFF